MVQETTTSQSFAKLLVRRCLSLWFGHRFERGFSYRRIKHTNLDLLEKHHYLMLADGWERDGDVEAGFTSAWCWYRRPNNA